MTNKRLLISNILSHHDEGVFFDRKEMITLSNTDGKAKLLRHICALSNSNPTNKSFIIVGVSNNNNLVGTQYIDDAHIQDLIQAYLFPTPKIAYENIAFPTLAKDRVIGLLTINPSEKIIRISKSIGALRSNPPVKYIFSKASLGSSFG